MSSMLVCYGEKSDESDLNSYFGEVILQLLEIESLEGRELKQWCTDRNIELPQDVWNSTADTLQQLSLFKFIICLQSSNQQLEQYTDEIFEEEQLLWADIRIEPLKFDDLYNLNGDMEQNYDDPLTKYALELYTTNLFLKCGAMYQVKDFVRNCSANKQKMNSLPSKRETFPELFDKGNESVVKIPWKFPKQFFDKVTEQHTLDSKVSISFSKMMLKEPEKLYKDVNPEDISPSYVKVDMKWLEGTNIYDLWKFEEDISQTSLKLEEIKQRQIERQRIFEDDVEFLTPKTEVELFQLYLSSTKNKTFTHNHLFDDKITIEENAQNDNYVNLGKENYTLGSDETESIGTALAFKPKVVTGLQNLTPLKSSLPHESGSSNQDLFTGLKHLMYIPKIGDVNEADCIIKIEIHKPVTSSLPRDCYPLTERLSRLCMFFKKEKTGKSLTVNRSIKIQNESVTEFMLPPVDSKVTFKKFFKAKLRQMRADFSYYKKVAMYCIDDIKHYDSEGSQRVDSLVS
ncbi:unnamed protein product [Kluyveromyces dobzhanskii CBS 2104]|uniref:WGS project CCBQ000000000 data, contig 00058 n=1 Tax=Kluyveromyces dobzhanskii CBS 2104 TaxID=1427455 RepID=A0A0A8LBV9_9SACH|nr:unnamed protein product [Kluyveromyces dobzhanskii CBS 2104]